MKYPVNTKREYTLEDLDCKYCLYYKYRRKGKSCSIDACCCAEEKRAAMKRHLANKHILPWLLLRNAILNAK